MKGRSLPRIAPVADHLAVDLEKALKGGASRELPPLRIP
jgi:hypothetical protein